MENLGDMVATDPIFRPFIEYLAMLMDKYNMEFISKEESKETNE